MRPGDTLTELGLAEQLGCSQGTVREILLRLQEDGLVVRAGYKGTVISSLDPEEGVEMLAVRKQIECASARRAALRLTAEAHAELVSMGQAMTEAALAEDEYTLTRLDTEFHLTIFRQSGLRALEQILTRCILHTHRSRLWAPHHRRPLIETAARHASILACLEARDGDGLAAALGRHLDTIVQPSVAGGTSA
jgi:DNA-binding GntR family transcriptional regulator